MSSRLIGALLLIPALAGAEPVVIHLDRPSILAVTVREDPARSKVVDLPPGYFFNEEAFTKIDAEFRRLQAVEEEHNAEQRGSVVAIAVAVGVVVGASAMIAAFRPWER